MTETYSIAILLFTVLIVLVFYTYVGYGIVAYLLVKIRRGLARRGFARRGFARRRFSESGAAPVQLSRYPDVTLIVPAYNEMDYLPAKLQNCLDQDYPTEHLHLLFVVEGSTDGSAEYLERRKAKLPNLTIIGGSRRLGKIEAMNQVMQHVHTPITIFTDANTRLNPQAVSRLVSRFELPNVGAVTGEKRISTYANESAAGSGEGLYWRYESFLKKLDAELHTIVGAAGELFAIRTDLYERVEADTLLDDFVISLRIAGRGFRVEYEPNAYALERPSHSVDEEMKRKVRIATGGFQAIRRLSYLLNIFRYGWLSFQYVSHRVLRWAVTPFCLPLLVLLNVVIVLEQSRPEADPVVSAFWWAVLLAQFAFYAVACVGYVLESRQTRWKVAFVPFYFVFMNWCVLLGFARFCRGNLSGVWEKARRAE